MSDRTLKVSGLIDESIVDGPGIRLVVFVQGCLQACPGCHNPETHTTEGGQLYNIDEILERYAENPLLDGVTFSGGEPFLQAYPLALLAKMIHGKGGTVFTYTGYVFENLVRTGLPGALSLLEETDLLIDGPYIEDQASLDLDFRGSANQRILDRKARAELLKYMEYTDSCFIRHHKAV